MDPLQLINAAKQRHVVVPESVPHLHYISYIASFLNLLTRLSVEMTLEILSPQGLNSKTFKGPVEIIANQTSTIPELFEWSSINNPEHPLFRYWDGLKLQDICYREVNRSIRKAAHIVLDALKASEEQLSSGKPPVVAILAIAGQFNTQPYNLIIVLNNINL